jgi:CRP/FNR family transcriptional regulator, cyclic AMP receptor protein
MSASRERRPAPTVSILEVDPGLGARLTESELAVARDQVRAEVVTLMRGAHDPATIGGSQLLALLVIDGWLMRSVTLGGRRSAVLIGRGTLLRPWDDHARYTALPFEVGWRALHPTRLALLDERTLAAVARWPQLLHALFRRSSERSHIQSLLSAVRALQHVELRLRSLLWLYADRYGRAAAGGVVLPVRLSHQDLADLTGSQRPSVSAHLAALAAAGEIVRLPDRTWLLRGGPPAELRDLRVRAGPEETVAVDGPAEVRAGRERS